MVKVTVQWLDAVILALRAAEEVLPQLSTEQLRNVNVQDYEVLAAAGDTFKSGDPALTAGEYRTLRVARLKEEAKDTVFRLLEAGQVIGEDDEVYTFTGDTGSKLGWITVDKTIVGSAWDIDKMMPIRRRMQVVESEES